MKKEYIPRLFDDTLDFALKTKGAVLITGPKWCGKSRTAERHANTVISLLPLSTRDQYTRLAKSAPQTFLSIGPKPILYDEWQIVSFIWDDIKSTIDKNDDFGQYILTGSVTDTLAQDESNEHHSGTGRIIRKRMRTMSLFESKDSSGEVSLSDLKNGVFKPCVSDKTIYDYAFYICRGGWPLSIGEQTDVALQQPIDFYEGLVTEDLFSLKDVPLKRNEQKARQIVRSYARNVGTQCPDTKMLKDISEFMTCDDETLSKYLLALKRLYVTDEVEAWNTNIRSKIAIRSKPTRYFVDPSIATSAFGISPNGLFKDMNTFGFLFESLAMRDLKVYADALNAKIYHYRDSMDREADAVIYFRDGEWGLVEIKLGEDDDIELAANKLVELSKDIVQEKAKPCFLMVISKGKFAYQRDDGVYVVPLACLRN